MEDIKGKLLGVIRSIDPLGRVTVPKEYRVTLGITNDTTLEIFKHRDGLFIRKYKKHIKRFDSLGRLVIPKEYRSALDINEGDQVEIFLYENGIFIRKYKGYDNHVKKEEEQEPGN